MYIKAINPTVLVAALDKRDETTTVSLLHGGGAIVGVVPTECAWGTCAQPGDLLAPVPAKLQGCAEAPQFARRLDGALRVDLRGFPPVLEGYHLCHAARSDCPPPDLPDKCGAKHFTMQCPGDADSGQCTGPPHVLPVRDAREAPQEVNPEQAKVLVKAANAEIVARQKELAPMRQLLQFRLGAAGGAPAGDELRVAVNDDGAVAPLVLAVYERGVRLAVGDWLAVVPKDLTNRCRGARKAAMRLTRAALGGGAVHAAAAGHDNGRVEGGQDGDLRRLLGAWDGRHGPADAAEEWRGGRLDAGEGDGAEGLRVLRAGGAQAHRGRGKGACRGHRDQHGQQRTRATDGQRDGRVREIRVCGAGAPPDDRAPPPRHAAEARERRRRARAAARPEDVSEI